MVTHVDVDVQQALARYRAEPTVELRNQLVERYLPLVKYNAERIWSRLPDGVELDDLISAGVFGLMDAIDAFDLDARRQIRDLLRAAYPRRDARRTAHDGLGAAAGAQQGQQARGGPQGARSRPRPAAQAPTKWPSGWACPLEEFDKMVGDATAVSLVSLNKKWYETDSYKDVREIDILEDKKAEDPTHRCRTAT